MKIKIKKKYLQDPNFSKRFDYVLQPKKCVHFRIREDVKRKLDYVRSQLGMNFQEVIDCLVTKVILEDPTIISYLNEYKMEKEEVEVEGLFNEYERDEILKDIGRIAEMERIEREVEEE